MINKLKCPLPEETPRNKRFCCVCGDFLFVCLFLKEGRNQTATINFSPTFFLCFTDLGVPVEAVLLKGTIFISKLMDGSRLL